MHLFKYISLSVLCLIICSSFTFAQNIYEYEISLYDNIREREIPIAIYTPSSKENKSVVILNHGYDQNRGGSYLVYSYLSRALAENSYFVISIQHELPDDDLLAMEGNLRETRLCNWERGVDNIIFAIKEFKKVYPELNWEDVTLLGHSNGGDICMLLATQYPDCGYRIISLDHRRMPVPRNKSIKVYSIRGCDYPADEGVLPDEEELKEYPITILHFADIKHGDMDDKGSQKQKKQIIEAILSFLEQDR